MTIRTKKAITALKLTVTVFAILWIIWLAGRPHLNPWNSGDVPLGYLRFQDVSGSLKKFSLSAAVNVVLLIAPGVDCPSCLENVRAWDGAAKRWGIENVSVAVIADGRYTNNAKVKLFKKAHSLASPVWIDEDGALRRSLRLPRGPLVAGFSSRGGICFLVPLRQSFSDQEEGVRFVDEILSSALLGN